MKRALAICAVLSCVSVARAHPVAQGSLEANIAASKVEVRARVSLEEIFVANAHDPIPATTLEEARAKHADYLLRHLRLFADEQPLRGTCVVPQSENTADKT